MDAAACSFGRRRGRSLELAQCLRTRQQDWGGYTADETARRHGVGVPEDTAEPEVAYAPFTRRKPTRYRDGWLPD